MEVPGKKEASKYSCKPCEESDVRTQADGFCTRCEEFMCTSCFDTHKKWKLNRDHTLSDCHETESQREFSNDFEKCEQHRDEPVKFYCVQHEQIGCGDCMIIGHRSCKVDYIPDLAKEMKVTSQFDSFTKGTEICQDEAERVLSSIKNNLVQVNDINEKFKQDVNRFRDEMITLVTNLANRMLEEGERIKAEDSSSMTDLVEATEGLMNELADISELIKSKVKSPSQLFVCSVSKKHTLDRIMKQLNEIKCRNKIEAYAFKKDIDLCRAFASTAKLGSIQKDKENDLDEDKEVPLQKHHASALVMAMRQLTTSMIGPQSLLDRQLVCRNIKMDGHFLSYMDNSNVGEVGIYVNKNRMENGSYFEIEILSVGQLGTIAIGLVPANYQENKQPGWEKDSIAYHADDGCLYHERGMGMSFGSVCHVEDKMGCGILYSKMKGPSEVFAIFTRNNKRIGQIKLRTGRNFNLYPAVGMHSTGEKVKVILDAKMPDANILSKITIMKQ